MLTLTQFVALYFLIAFFTFIYILYLRDIGEIIGLSWKKTSFVSFLLHFVIISLFWPIFLIIVLIHYLILRFK